MSIEKGLQFETKTDKETMGHIIEKGVAEFLDSGVFDCIDGIEKTIQDGSNDKKGIDLVINFSDGSKMAVDVTTASIGSVASKKLESMSRNPLTMVIEERNEEGTVTVEKSEDLVPRAIISIGDQWEEYCDPVNDTMLLHMSETVELKEKAEMIKKMLFQIDTFSRGDAVYRKKTEGIKNLLEKELEEIEKEVTLQ